MKKPTTTNEKFIEIDGKMKLLHQKIHIIETNHLKHMHADIDKLGGKVDKIYWVLLATVGTVALFFLDKLLS